MRNPYEKLGFVDRPFNPSGVPPVKGLYSIVGMDREVDEVLKAVNVFLRGSDNMLLVIVGPYGFGKSDLLNVIENRLREGGIEVVRTALSLGLDIRGLLVKVLSERDPEKPLVIMFDEADELSRAVSISGGVTSEVRELILNVAGIIRAILEPRNYSQLLNIQLNKLGRILVIASFTPQLYYGILRSSVPDVFDISRGRVFKEVVIDERFPYWLYEAMVVNRLTSYSTKSRLDMVNRGLLSPLSPFDRETLSFIYLVARRMENGQASPRNLIKLTSKLFEYVADGGGSLSMDVKVRFVKTELGKYINLDAVEEVLRYGPEVAKVALSGIPVAAERDVELSGIVERVKVVEVDPTNPNEVRRVNEIRMMYGKPPITVDDLRTLSIEYGSYYTAPTDNGVRLYVILPSNAPVEGFIAHDAYVLKRGVHERMLGISQSSVVDDLGAYVRRVASLKPSELATELVKLLSGSHVARLNGLEVAVVDNGLDARLAYVATDSIEKLQDIVSNCIVRIDGQVKYIDGLVAVIVDDRALGSQLKASQIRARWCDAYEPSQRVLLLTFGSDELEKIRSMLIGLYTLSKASKVPDEYVKHVQNATWLLEKVSAFRDSLRNTLLQYTLGLPRRKEGKREALKAIVLSWVNGTVDPAMPQAFRCGDKPCISKVEEILANYLANINKPIDERELEAVIRRLFPTHLWRDFRERDLVELMELRGLIYGLGDKYLSSAGRFQEAVKATCSKVKDLAGRIITNIDVTVDEWRLTIKASTADVEAELRSLEDECRLMATVMGNPSEEDFKRLARLNLRIADIEDRVNELLRNINEVSGLIKETLTNMKRWLDELSKLPQGLPSRLAESVKVIVNETLRMVNESIGGISGLGVDKAKEAIGRISSELERRIDLAKRLVNAATSIVVYAKEYNAMAETLVKASKITNDVDTEYETIDMEALWSSIEDSVSKMDVQALEVALAEMENKVKLRRARLMDAISKLRNYVSSLTKTAEWLEYRGVLSGIKIPNLDSLDIGELNARLSELLTYAVKIESALNDLSTKLKIPLKLLKYIASRGPNVGLDEVVMARDLGMESSEVLRYLELLWRAKLVDKRYVS